MKAARGSYNYIVPKNYKLGYHYTLSFWQGNMYEVTKCEEKGLITPRFWLRLM